MKFVNGWKYLAKDRARFQIRLRLGILSIIDIDIDVGDARWKVGLLNFFVQSKE